MIFIYSRHPLSIVDYDNPGYLLGIIPGIFMDMTKADKPSAPPAPPPLPNQATANQAASATVKDQRETMLASGGITDYTGGLGVLTGSDVSKQSLVGG